MYNLAMIAVMALVTMSTRFLPFLIFNETRKTPKLITYLGKVLPCAIMGMLVIYCLKDVSVSSYPYGLSELFGIAFVAVLHLWKRNSLLSIGAGTVFYMVLVQFIF